MGRGWRMALGLALVSVFCLTYAAEQATAAQREIGGYVAQAESRFVRNVWNFIKYYGTWKTIGGHQWKRSQYYWMEPWVFEGSHSAYVDAMDLAYVACHGNYWVLCCHDGIADVDLRNCPAYGDLPNGGDLEFLVVESCSTITSAADPSFDWNGWRHNGPGGVFGGLHQAMGFHTLSYSDNWVPKWFALRTQCNEIVWQAWFWAVQMERAFPQRGPWEPEPGVAYPGWASAIMAQKCKWDRMGSYVSDPTAADLLYSVWEE
ncbi:MAG: DUF6345 domain-containing protein [Armatimonadota bacterium]